MAERSPATGRSDDELVAAFQRDPDGPAGRRALDELVGRWSGRVVAWSYRYLGDREQALDLAHDALLDVLKALGRYEARGRFSAWLFTIVHHRCMDALRRRRTSPVRMEDPDAFESPADTAWWADRALEHERVLAAMRDHLRPEERLALWLRVEEEASVEDITRMLGLTNASGARGLLQTARRKLRAALDGRGNAPGKEGS